MHILRIRSQDHEVPTEHTLYKERTHYICEHILHIRSQDHTLPTEHALSAKNPLFSTFVYGDARAQREHILVKLLCMDWWVCQGTDWWKFYAVWEIECILTWHVSSAAACAKGCSGRELPLDSLPPGKKDKKIKKRRELPLDFPQVCVLLYL